MTREIELSVGATHADDLVVRVVPHGGHHLHEENPDVVADTIQERFAATDTH